MRGDIEGTSRSGLSASLDILQSDYKPASLNRRLVDAVSALMPAEIISLNSFALDGSMLGIDLVSPGGSIPLALQDVFPRLVHEHPLYANSVRLKYQDFK